MDYIEGLVIAVPTKNKDAFINHSKEMAALFKENGAIRFVDCWGDDVKAGEVTSFPQAVKCKDDETVVFSWVVWPSRKSRDTGMENIMKDPRMSEDSNSMPFDGSRLIFGGFQMIVDE